MTSREKSIAIMGIFAILAISSGLGGFFGWPAAILALGLFALVISWSQA